MGGGQRLGLTWGRGPAASPRLPAPITRVSEFPCGEKPPSSPSPGRIVATLGHLPGNFTGEQLQSCPHQGLPNLPPGRHLQLAAESDTNCHFKKIHSTTHPATTGECLQDAGLETVQASCLPQCGGAWRLSLPMPVPRGGTYQGSTAEQDHEDDEGLEPVVLDDLEAGPAEGPPRLPAALGDVHVEEGAALHTGWGSDGGTRSQAWGLPPDAGSTCPAPAQGALSSHWPRVHSPALHHTARRLGAPSTRLHVLHCWLDIGGKYGDSAPPLEALPPQPTPPMCQLPPGTDTRRKDTQGCRPPARVL